MKKKWIVVFALLAVVLAAVMFREQNPKTQEFSPTGETLILDGCRCVLFTGESSEPKKVRRMLLDEIARLRAKGVDEELFTLCKNQLYGEMLCDLENIEATAGGMASSHLHGHTLADELKTLAGIQKQDVDAALQTMLREERSAAVLIRPLKETPQ